MILNLLGKKVFSVERDHIFIWKWSFHKRKEHADRFKKHYTTRELPGGWLVSWRKY